MTEKMNRSEIMIFDRSNSTHSLQKRARGVRLAAQPDLWAKQMLLMQYLSEADTLAADALLQTIPINSLNSSQQAEWNDLAEYYSLYKQMEANENNLLDSLQLIALTELATHVSAAGSYARNLLISQGEMVYYEPYIFPDDNLKSGKVIRKKQIIGGNNVVLKVYPNPATNYIVAEYQLNESINKPMLNLIDVLGRTQHSIILPSYSGYKVIPLINISPGIYTITLSINGRIVNEAKVVVSR